MSSLLFKNVAITRLVFAAAPDITTECELLLGELVLAEQVVELVHRQVDDVVAGNRQAHRLRLSLVPEVCSLLKFFISLLYLFLNLCIVDLMYYI